MKAVAVATMHNQQKVRGTKPLRVSLIFAKTLNFSLLFLAMALSMQLKQKFENFLYTWI